MGYLVNIKIAGKWMFIPLKMVLIGIDPYPYVYPILLDIVQESSFQRLSDLPTPLETWKVKLPGSSQLLTISFPFQRRQCRCSKSPLSAAVPKKSAKFSAPGN